MFHFESIQLKALIKLLNYINYEYVSGADESQSSPSSCIQSLEQNKHLVVNNLLNCIRLFDQQFHHHYAQMNELKSIINTNKDSYVLNDEEGINRILEWLESYYPALVINSLRPEGEDIPSQTLASCLLLIIVLFYKLRQIFPKMKVYFEFAWIYLCHFEEKIEPLINVEKLVHLLQSELVSIRGSQRLKRDMLMHECQQLRIKVNLLENQLEQETQELIMLQSKTIDTQAYGGGQKSGPINDKRSANNNFPCPDCDKSFKNSYKLNRHRYVHKPSSEKPFECDWPGCGYRFIAKNDLIRHKMIHTGEKPFTCDAPGCNKKFSRSDKLKKHMRMHIRKNAILSIEMQEEEEKSLSVIDDSKIQLNESNGFPNILCL